jgi:superfamily II DNA/RNA helicase
MSTTFAQLGVPPFICTALAERGITELFAIQTATVADALAGRDVLGRAPTGSGKTLAFGVPLIATATRADAGAPTALVLAPTRELAEQITTELRSFAGRLRVEAVYGGVGYGKQINALRRGVDVLVACPGRLEDLIQRRDVTLQNVHIVVLDEADRMADMGFMPAVRRLLDQTASDRQTVLFSATLDGDVAKLTRDYQRDPVRHEVGEETPDVKAATHRFFNVDRNDRNPVVADVVNAAWPSIIFTRTRHGADRLAKQLDKLGFKAAPIHGGRSQSQRNRALDDFTNQRVHALVATDVAARGIHVDGVASVIHYDPPEDHKTYVHRSGRTARAGADGLVVSLVQPEQKKDYRRMQREVGLDEPFMEPALTELPAPDTERQLAPASLQPVPEDRPRNGRGNGGRNQNGRPQNGRNGSRNGSRASSSGRGPSGQGRRDGEGRGDAGERRGGESRSADARGSEGRGVDRHRSGEAHHAIDDRGHARSGDARRSGSNTGRSASPASGRASGSRKPDNRKARRAHLQPR